MGDSRVEVLKYSRAVQKIREQWRQQTQKELAKDLEPIAKELEKLGPLKNAGPEEKKTYAELLNQSRKITEKRLKQSASKIERDLGKVKRPDIEDDDKHARLMEQSDEDMEKKGIEIEVPEAIADRYKLTKNLKLTLDVDDKGISVGYVRTF